MSESLRGRLITFEGPEGGGKTTQALRLVARLEAEGRAALYTREPGGTAVGEAIRQIIQYDAAGESPEPGAEVLLFAASRAQLVAKVILPALSAGTWVVCDRFADSTTAYQGSGRGFGIEPMLAINAFSIGTATPDLTLLLDLNVERGLDRIAIRRACGGAALDRIECEQQAFHERVRNGYLELARRWPKRIQVLDAGQPEDTVAQAVWSAVNDVCGC